MKRRLAEDDDKTAMSNKCSLNDDDDDQKRPAAAAAPPPLAVMPTMGTPPPPPPRRCREASTATCSGTAASGAEDSYIYSEDDDDDDDDNDGFDNYQEEDSYNNAKHLAHNRAAVPAAAAVTTTSSTTTTTLLPPRETISVGGYSFWSTAQARHSMDDSVRETSELLCLPTEAARAVLRKYQWDGKRLQDDYFSGSSSSSSSDNNNKQQDIQAECGVFHRCRRATGNNNNNNNNCKDNNNNNNAGPSSCCAICLEDELEAGKLFGMACGHEFCKDCWSGYIAEAVSLGPPCVRTQCPDAGCSEVVTQEEVRRLAPPGVLAKYQEYLLRSDIESNWVMRWCMSCDLVAVGSSADGLVGEGECQCGTRFCLRCGEIRHVPATCDMMVLWGKKCQDDSETANWIIAKTKKCPKCQARIDKNGGCNHMRCSQCNHNFCWLCMQDWTNHGSCNTFALEQAKEMGSTKADAERELECYLHCFNRFQNHAQGQDFAKKELEKFEQTQEENEKKDSSFDWNALKNALGQLVECRRVLKYTYVVTYYLGDKPVQRELFEDHQGLLESFTERLSEISEKNYKSIDRTELVNLTRIVDRYTKSVMDCEIDETL